MTELIARHDAINTGYEHLRSSFLNSKSQGHSNYALALLMRNGMLAWAKVWTSTRPECLPSKLMRNTGYPIVYGQFMTLRRLPKTKVFRN